MEQKLKKGTWSKQEDEILIEYVNRYGSKNWNNVQRLTGLPRDGKSCRFRWLNQLDPSLKKGKYSQEEKQKIIQLRQLNLNCPWSKIAEQFPGRTDNEVKNIWYSYERKKHKMENVKEKCQKKKKKLNHLPLNNEVKKPHDNELNDNGESVISGFMSNQQQDISGTHERELMKDSFHIPIMQPSNTLLCNVASTSISKNSSPTFIDRDEASFVPIGMESNLPPLPESVNFESPLPSYTSMSNNSSPKIIDRGEAPFMPIGMLSDYPPLLEIESPLPSYTSERNISSPTFIERGETSFASMDMIPDLAPLPLPESIDFQSPLSDKYPPLPLRSLEEIQQQQLEENSPPNNGFLFVEENGNKPISLEKDESKNEDLIDIFDSLGWLDGYIF